MTNSNVLKVVTELLLFSSLLLLYIAFLFLYVAAYMANKVGTSHNRASRDCGSTVNTTIYPKGYAQTHNQNVCIVTMRAGDG